MESQESPVKGILYDTIRNIGEKKIEVAISKGDSKKIIQEILNKSIIKIKKLTKNSTEEQLTLATGLLHYLLTVSLIDSQRKITIDDNKIDIVIPNTKKLKDNPNDSIIIQIISNNESPDSILQKLSSIQPNQNNIWFITDKPISNNNSYTIEENYVKILEDIQEFYSMRKKSQLKIFKV